MQGTNHAVRQQIQRSRPQHDTTAVKIDSELCGKTVKLIMFNYEQVAGSQNSGTSKDWWTENATDIAKWLQVKKFVVQLLPLT